MPVIPPNAAASDWSAEPASNMRSFPVPTRGYPRLFHIFTNDATFRMVG